MSPVLAGKFFTTEPLRKTQEDTLDRMKKKKKKKRAAFKFESLEDTAKDGTLKFIKFFESI